MKHFISSLSVLCANTPPCEGRVSSRKILSLLLILFLSIGNAWGQTVETVDLSAGEKSTNITWSAASGNITITQTKGTSSTAIGDYIDAPRIYKGHVLSFEASGDYKIKQIDITYTGTRTGNSMTAGTVINNNAVVDNTAEVNRVWATSSGGTHVVSSVSSEGLSAIHIHNVASAENVQLRPTEIKITYVVSSGGSTDPSLSANPTEIDFGTVYQDATVEDKTVAVNFANLTGSVSYSGLSTPFTATGAISATGDKITISADASTIGEYSQTLTVASTADSKTAKVTVKMNVVAAPAPTGTFTLHTGALVEGDYVIVSTNSLKAEVNSDRLASLPVTISNDEIVDPDATTIWHIAKSGEYWTLYNANKAKYAASTGVKNKAALLDDGSDDKALWSASGTNTYEFVNKKNTEAAVNANLRYNSQNAENSRWACYSTSTGAALSLYRKAGTKYNVNISATTNGSVTANPTSAEAGTTIALTVTPDAGYVLDALTVTDASSNTVTVTNNEFTMPASDVTVTATFKLNEKPAAILTLSKNGVTEDITGYKQDDVVTLPTTVDTDCVKEFVGWSADANCATEPEYAPGASYTLASTSQTLYAVYATVEGGEATASVDMATYANDNSWGSSSSTNQKEININSDLKAVISEGGNSGKYYNDGVRIYQTEDATVTVSTTAGELKSVKFTFTIANNGTLLHEGVAMTSDEAVEVSGNSAVFTVGDTHATENKGQVRFTAIEVVYTGGATYSNYSTTCAAALANPTFSLAEGKYTEAKSVTISAAEGTIYYTLDGTDPTVSGTQYAGAISLNDCGEYTIKAIAISADSQSDVVSATYTIKLPLTNSQAAPYTEAEAIAVYDGGCYDNQDVYVKGTVKTATFNSTYGNYTITLTNGFQFYRFLQAAETKFTEDIIVPGDVLVACGKLSKYNTTYQLAEGCYLVERIPYEGEKTDISNTEATAYTVDQAFALIADVSSDLTKEVYVKGLVAVAPTSNPTADGQMTYKISDNGENTSNVLTVYLGLNLNGEKFTSKNDVQQGDYVVVKGKLLDYNSTYELNKGNQLVQHIKAATITIADITMEVGENKTIAATITPAAAETAVVYTIKENTDNAISLSGNTITANAVGTATITATIATAAEYMGKTVEFEVTVTPKSTKEKVVILAQYEGQWYAMKAQYVTDKTSHLAPLPVTYFDGKLYNVKEADKALIEWERAVVDGKATFYNDGKYLTGKSGDTDLTLAATACEWTISGDSYLIGARTFLYNAENNWFRNFGTGNAGNKNYSDMPTVTAPVYATGDIVYTRDVTPGNYGTICLPYASDNFTGATFFEVAGKEGDKVFFDEVTTLEAGKPYIFMAESNKIVLSQTGESAVEAGKSNSLQGTFSQINPAVDNVLVGNYMVVNNVIKKCGVNCGLQAYRAYFIAGELESLVAAPAPAPGVRRVSMGVTGQNTATGVDQVQGDNVPAKMIINGQLFILRGEKMYDAQGKLVK